MSIIVQTHQYRTDNRIYVGSEGKEPLTVHEYDIRGEKIRSESHSNINFTQYISKLAQAPSNGLDVKERVLAQVNTLIKGIEQNIHPSVSESLTCAICFKLWDQTVEIFSSCGHSFHVGCIQSNECPLCRRGATQRVPNYALREAMAEISTEKSPIPLLSIGRGPSDIQLALGHINKAKNHVTEGKEEEALNEFELAFTYTNRSEDYQELPKALETFAKAAMGKHPLIFKTATQKAQLAYLYLTKYQLEENNIEEALKSLSQCAWIDADLEAVLQVGQIFERQGILAPLFSKVESLSEIKDAEEAFAEVKKALLTPLYIEKERDLTDTLEQLLEVGYSLSGSVTFFL